MTNRDHAAIWAYHDGTKHSIASLRRSPHAAGKSVMFLMAIGQPAQRLWH